MDCFRLAVFEREGYFMALMYVHSICFVRLFVSLLVVPVVSQCMWCLYGLIVSRVSVTLYVVSMMTHA